jgi:3-oxoacyl-[acyl-carrier protein] reductase
LREDLIMPRAKRTALITGSNKNIGRACALALAKSGSNIVVNGAKDSVAAESVAREARTLGVEALVAMGDVGMREDAARIAEEALKSFGSVDILVNNAAVRVDKKFLEMSEEAWRYAMAVNFDSAYWLSRACLPGMVEKRWGRIVNFAGMNAINGSLCAHVCAAKHAAWGLTKALAKEFGGTGITVNIVSPGPIVGEGHDPAVVAVHLAIMKARVPVGRVGTPDEVAAVVGLLASDAGAFVNGQMIQVNGGAET